MIMTHEHKKEKFLAKDGREAFHTRTPFERLPIIMKFGSSTHHPERKGGMTTSDIVLWVKFLDNWFRPYGGFGKEQIEKMIELCHNDNQIVSLMELLSAKKEMPNVEPEDERSVATGLNSNSSSC